MSKVLKIQQLGEVKVGDAIDLELPIAFRGTVAGFMPASYVNRVCCSTAEGHCLIPLDLAEAGVVRIN